MPMMNALLGIEKMVRLDPRQQELLAAHISTELRANPEIQKILQKRANEALDVICSTDRPGR